MEFLSQHPAVAVLVGLIATTWLALFLLLPFIAEGIRAWTIKNHRELRAISAKLDRLNALLAGRAAAERGDGEAARREPTISDFDVDVGEERRRRP